MAAPSRGEATQAFINLVSRAQRLTPDLPTTMLPVLSADDIERISLVEATMVPILSTLLLAVNDMRTEIAVLHSSIEALDTHTRTLLKTTQVQGAVQDGATKLLSHAIRDLSHRMAGAMPTQLALASTCQSSGRSEHAAPPGGVQQSRPPPLNTNQPKQGMDPDIPRYDPAAKILYGNPEAYANMFPNPWEARAFKEGNYPPTNTFKPGQEDPLWAAPPRIPHTYSDRMRRL